MNVAVKRVQASPAAYGGDSMYAPSTIQPHGYLFCVDPRTLEVLQASENAPGLVGKALPDIIGRSLPELLHSDLVAITQHLTRLVLPVDGRECGFHVLTHASPGGIVVELEPVPDAEEELNDPYSPLEDFISNHPGGGDTQTLVTLAAEIIRRVTPFDHVLVFQFDAEWNSTVIAESRNDAVPSYLGLSFPGNMPEEARQQFCMNRIRLTPDARYNAVPLHPLLNPKTNAPLDLTYSSLRSASPVDLECMQRMDALSSMSLSIIRDGSLWGLISCFKSAPCTVSFPRRSVCDILCQVLSLQLAVLERNQEAQHLIALQTIQTRILRNMAAKDNFSDGLRESAGDLLSLAGADGVAILFEKERYLIGATPDAQEVEQIERWLEEEGEPDVFSTDSFAEALPEAEAWKSVASGLLAISISKMHRTYILWFRRERLHLKSAPWRSSEISAVTDFRNSVMGVVLQRAEELAQLNAELERSNKDLEAFSYSVSHDLRAPLRHIAGYAELLSDDSESRLGTKGLRYLDTIKESVEFAGTLVDNLLQFSRLGRSRLKMSRVDLEPLIRGVITDLEPDLRGRTVEWRIHSVPSVEGDSLLLQVVLRNLLSNALKYTKKRDVAVIEIGAQTSDREHIISVKDNGAGFDMQFKDKLFGVFQRLHRIEDFEGTGIGLANVRRIISRHGGRTWAEGAPDHGATFYVSLPSRGSSETI